MKDEKRVLTAVLVSLVALAASSGFVSCSEKKTTVIRESRPSKTEPGIQFKLKTGDVDVEGKIPNENK